MAEIGTESPDLVDPLESDPDPAAGRIDEQRFGIGARLAARMTLRPRQRGDPHVVQALRRAQREARRPTAVAAPFETARRRPRDRPEARRVGKEGVRTWRYR